MDEFERDHDNLLEEAAARVGGAERAALVGALVGVVSKTAEGAAG